MCYGDLTIYVETMFEKHSVLARDVKRANDLRDGSKP